MSLYPEREATLRHYDFNDNATTKIVDAIDFVNDSYTEFQGYIIRIGDDDAIVEGDILGEYRMNTDYSGLSRGSIIYDSAAGDVYQVVKKPRPNVTFSKYHVNFKYVTNTN